MTTLKDKLKPLLEKMNDKNTSHPFKNDSEAGEYIDIFNQVGKCFKIKPFKNENEAISYLKTMHFAAMEKINKEMSYTQNTKLTNINKGLGTLGTELQGKHFNTIMIAAIMIRIKENTESEKDNLTLYRSFQEAGEGGCLDGIIARELQLIFFNDILNAKYIQHSLFYAKDNFNIKKIEYLWNSFENFCGGRNKTIGTLVTLVVFVVTSSVYRKEFCQTLEKSINGLGNLISSFFSGSKPPRP